MTKPKRRQRSVNRKARQIVIIAMKKKGYTYEDIATLCNVSTGSVKRWLSTGRADKNKILPLEEEVGPVYLNPDDVGDILIDIYKKRNKRFRLKRFQLKRIAGRSSLRNVFIEELTQTLLNRGFFILEGVEKEDDFFIIIRVRQLLKYVKGSLRTLEISEYYHDLADEIDDSDNEYDEE